MTRLGLQKLLERFPPDAPVAFADPSLPNSVGTDFLESHFLTEDDITQGVETFRESYITPEGRICQASDFVLIRPPVIVNPFAF